MIQFKNETQHKPFIRFKKEYDRAELAKEKHPEAACISSYDCKKKEIDSRYVNIKFLDGTNFIFFSNYNSPKAIQFNEHKQMTCVFFWENTQLQIRIKALIKKTNAQFNSNYFKTRDVKKNALAISSDQSEPISSYNKVIKKYERTIKIGDLHKCPKYWGGYSLEPYYFEFWQGHKSRINKRDVYEFNNSDNNWIYYNIQP